MKTQRYNAETLMPTDYFYYRLLRFGPAGTRLTGGVERAGTVHGVSARAWAFYESGKRTPKLTERKRIATWLNRSASRKPRFQFWETKNGQLL